MTGNADGEDAANERDHDRTVMVGLIATPPDYPARVAQRLGPLGGGVAQAGAADRRLRGAGNIPGEAGARSSSAARSMASFRVDGGAPLLAPSVDDDERGWMGLPILAGRVGVHAVALLIDPRWADPRPSRAVTPGGRRSGRG